MSDSMYLKGSWNEKEINMLVKSWSYSGNTLHLSGLGKIKENSRRARLIGLHLNLDKFYAEISVKYRVIRFTSKKSQKHVVLHNADYKLLEAVNHVLER